MSDLPGIKKKAGPILLAVAILAIIALVFLIGSILFATRFVEETIKYVVDNIANRAGLSIFLVRGIVILVTIPFFWAVGKFTKNVIGLFNLGWDSMALYKNPYGRIIVVYVAAYFFVIYWASMQALAYKYCAETPEGTWTSDGSGKDPVYGIESKSCTMEQKLALRAGTGHLKPPNEITVTDAANYKWFNALTGRPLVWYSVLPDSKYRFFDSPGADPHDRQELKPVTAAIVDLAQQQQISQATAQKQAAEMAAESIHNEEAARNTLALKAQNEVETAALTKDAESAFEAKDFKSAFDSCVRVLKTSGGNQPCSTIKQHASTKLAQQLVVQARTHFERAEFDEALWSAEDALALDPNSQGALKLKNLALQMKPHDLQ